MFGRIDLSDDELERVILLRLAHGNGKSRREIEKPPWFLSITNPDTERSAKRLVRKPRGSTTMQSTTPGDHSDRVAGFLTAK